MSDRSFGDHAFRSVVKNPLLSTSVTGVSIEDLTQNAVLLPAVPSQEMSTRRDERSESQTRTLTHSDHDFANLQSGDTNFNIYPPNTLTSLDLNPPRQSTQNVSSTEVSSANAPKASVKSDDDFDVNEYFARLHGTRYVSAPLNSVLKEDQNANLEAVEENLEEINLNEPEKAISPDIQQSLTADIAQNFSQLPTVLPQMASVVFNSFSNMLSMKSREQTPDEGKRYDERMRPMEVAPAMPVPDIVKDIAPPPLKEPPAIGTSNYRITTKKKVYAQIPGLSTGETVQNTQTYSQPQQPTPYSYFTPDTSVPTVSEPIEDRRDVETEIRADADSTNDWKDDKNTTFDIFAPVDTVKAEEEAKPVHSNIHFPTQPLHNVQDASAPVNTAQTGTVIPPPPMFSNLSKRDQVSVEKTILPPSVARRISAKSTFKRLTPSVPRYSNETFMPRSDMQSQSSQSTSINVSQSETTLSNTSLIGRLPSAPQLPPASVPASSVFTGVLPPASVPVESTVVTHGVLPPANLPDTSIFTPGVLPPSSLPTASTVLTSGVLPPTNLPAVSTVQTHGVLPPANVPTTSTLYTPGVLPPASLPATSAVLTHGGLPPVSLPATSTVLSHDVLPPASLPAESGMLTPGVLPPTNLPTASMVLPPSSLQASSMFTGVLPPRSVPTASTISMPGVLPPSSINMPAALPQEVVETATVLDNATPTFSPSVLPPRDVSSGYLPPSVAMPAKPSTSTAICPPPIKSSMLPPTDQPTQLETVFRPSQQSAYPQTAYPEPNVCQGLFPTSSYFSNDSKPPNVADQVNISTPPMFFNPSSAQAQRGNSENANTGTTQQNVLTQFFNPNDIPPTPTKSVPEPPKASTGSNFRMIKKKPQYYSGPIEGVGSISNNIKPVLTPVQSTSFQGSLFTPQESNEALTQSAPSYHGIDSTVGQIPSDNFTIPKPLSNDNYNSVVTQPPQQQSTFNTVFDMSRPTTDRYEPPPQETGGFGLIGSLKSKLSSIDIGKIQNTVTTFFDPAYNDVKTNPSDSQVTYEAYSNSQSTSAQLQDQAACLEMLVVPTAEPAQMNYNANYYQQQELYTQQIQQQIQQQQQHQQLQQQQQHQLQQQQEQLQSQQQHLQASGLGQFGDTNVHNEPNILDPVAQYFRASGIPVPDCISGHYNDKSFAEKSAAIEAIADALDSGLLNDIVKEKPDTGPLLVYSFGPEDESDPPGTVYPKVISTLPLDEEEQKKVLEELMNRPADKYGEDLSNVIEPSKSRSPTPVRTEQRNVEPSTSKFEHINFNNEFLEQYFANNAGPQYYDSFVKYNSSSENTCYGSDSSNKFKPYDRPKKGPELEAEMRNMTLTSNIITSNDAVNSMVKGKPFETKPSQIINAAVIEPESEEKDINDVTKQLIENITAPIQLSNPVEVPLTESSEPIDDNPEFSSNQFAEISHIAEETIETIQVQSATELLQGADVDDTVYRNYGWRTDNVILPSTTQRDAYVNPDANAIGFLQNATFFDNVLANASDELKAECVHTLDEHTVLPRQMSVPTAPPAEEDSKSDESLLDVQSIEQDANKDFLYVHEFAIEPETDDGKIKVRERSSDDHAHEVDSFTNRVEKFKKLEETAVDNSDDVTDRPANKPYPSYLDTGNFAADTHYKNLPQPSFTGYGPHNIPFRIPPGFEQEYYRKYFIMKEHNLEREFQKQMAEVFKNANEPQIPETSTQTSISNTVTTTQANTEDLEKVETSSDKIEALVQKFINRERKYKRGRMKFKRNMPPPLALTLGLSDERATELFGHLVPEDRTVLTNTRTEEETIRAILRHVHHSPTRRDENANEQNNDPAPSTSNVQNDPWLPREEVDVYESSEESSNEDIPLSQDSFSNSYNAWTPLQPNSTADFSSNEGTERSGNVFTQLDTRTTTQQSIQVPSTSNLDNFTALQEPVTLVSTEDDRGNDDTSRASERLNYINAANAVQLYPVSTKQNESVETGKTSEGAINMKGSESTNLYAFTTEQRENDASNPRALEGRSDESSASEPLMYAFSELRVDDKTETSASAVATNIQIANPINLFSNNSQSENEANAVTGAAIRPVNPVLPDPVSFFSIEPSSSSQPSILLSTQASNDDEEQSSFSRLSSYFSAPATTREDHSKSFFELSQSQNHYRQNRPIQSTEQNANSFFNTANVTQATASTINPQNIPQNVYSANMSLVRELASTKTYFTPPNVVTTANYFTVHYDNDIAFNLNIGEPDVTEKCNVNIKKDETKEPFKLGELGEIETSDDSVIVNNCKYCCNMTSGRITKFDIDNVDLNDKIKQSMNSDADAPKTGDNMMEESKEVKKKTPHSVNFDTSSLQEEPNEAVSMMTENRSSSEYSPVKFHWFYRVDVEEKSVWRGFSITDSRTLERTFHSHVHTSVTTYHQVDCMLVCNFNRIKKRYEMEFFKKADLNENTLVATDGGRYDVNIVARQRTAVYWPDKPTNVRRCSWFYKGTTDARYVPYTEQVAEKLEEEFRHGVTTGEWHRRLVLPNNEMVVMHGPAVMVHFLQTNNEAFNSSPMFSFGKRVYRNPPKIGVSEDQRGKIDHLIFLVHGAGEYRHHREKVLAWDANNQSMMRPRVVRRGHAESEIEDSEPSSIDHLLFLCHGVGSACDMRFRPVEEVVDDFRATSLQLLQSHYRNSYDNGLVGRVEVLPISWHASLHSRETGVDRRLAAVTLESIPRLRGFTNDTILDALFYTSPVYSQFIIDTVCREMNRIYSLFKQRNPEFKGGVSLGGHSLGSVILYDLLCHQTPSEESKSPRASRKQYVSNSAGVGQPPLQYPRLDFVPRALYALGSPIAIFECIRGVETLGQKFCLPTCKNFFNIFHPYDPIAYRIEPMINADLRDIKPHLIPHHKGRKRMHLELKDTMARVGADIKQKIIESIKSTWSSMWKTQPPPDQHLEKVVEEEMEKEESDEERKDEINEAAMATPDMLGKLNAGRRIDYVLQEAPFEMINEYLFAMRSHVCYWESEDTMLLILREIYDSLGVRPDCSVPQQSLSVERTRTLSDDESFISAADSPSTSRGSS